MERFDDWVTDRGVTLDKIREFQSDRANLGKRFQGQYMVYRTSGSTGTPSIVVRDEWFQEVTSALFTYRGLAHAWDLVPFVLRGRRTAGICVDNGFNLANSSAHRAMLDPRARKFVLMVDILRPMPDIVREMNAFQPVLLGGYPSAMALLAEEQLAGRLRLRPIVLTGSGERMDPSTRALLDRAFHCHVQSDYGCTEASMIGAERSCGRYHLNDDWYVIEPVDEAGAPVPPGRKAHKVLLTNLANLVQPIIRYELTDRVTVHEGRCRCGCKSPWIEVDGRTDDVLAFEGERGPVQIHPFAVDSILKETPGMRRFQLIQHEGGRIELRIVADDRAKAFRDASASLVRFLGTHGVKASCFLSPDAPRADERTGKFTAIVRYRPPQA
jgi:phenylacetate-coenzyme A ligase PaaK-like adenylate-forming protein